MADGRELQRRRNPQSQVSELFHHLHPLTGTDEKVNNFSTTYAEVNMLDLVKKLFDLKTLLGEAYFRDLQELALKALAKDWPVVVHLAFALAEKVALEHLFPVATLGAEPVTEAALDGTLQQLSDSTEEVTVGAAAPAISPGEVIAIITMIADLIKLWRERKKQ